MLVNKQPSAWISQPAVEKNNVITKVGKGVWQVTSTGPETDEPVIRVINQPALTATTSLTQPFPFLLIPHRLEPASLAAKHVTRVRKPNDSPLPPAPQPPPPVLHVTEMPTASRLLRGVSAATERTALTRTGQVGQEPGLPDPPTQLPPVGPARAEESSVAATVL